MLALSDLDSIAHPAFIACLALFMVLVGSYVWERRLWLTTVLWSWLGWKINATAAQLALREGKDEEAAKALDQSNKCRMIYVMTRWGHDNR